MIELNAWAILDEDGTIILESIRDTELDSLRAYAHFMGLDLPYSGHFNLPTDKLRTHLNSPPTIQLTLSILAAILPHRAEQG